MNAAGGKNVKEDLKKGATIGGHSYKVHLDGYDLGPALRGEAKEWPRRDFIYWTDDGSVAALRYDNLEDHVPGAAGRGPEGLAGCRSRRCAHRC